ncbi:MAG: PEP-CTERM sorting domain-containing protein [Phycisphaerales bacterium]|nr:PEP-CTERM sorting domain-containing protein [Phycisphaerales bacterium]
MHLVLRLSLAALLATLGTLPRAAAQASFEGLGTLPGASLGSSATSLSADGSTVVGYAGSVSETQAYRWTRAAGMQPLGHLPDGEPFSYAIAVSGDGAIVVGSSGGEAFRWTQATGIVGLGDLEGGYTYSQANGISADGGTIVGTGSSAEGQEAFLWTESSGMVGLGDIPGDQGSSIACSVSSDGTVIVGIGQLGCRGGCRKAFRWTSETGMTALADFPGGSDRNQATAVSADGRVIVGTGNIGVNCESGGCVVVDGEAFRWTANEGMTRLGQLIEGGPSFAYAVSGDGRVIVGTAFDEASLDFVAFIWDPVNGMRSLSGLLINQYGLDLTGWTLSDATAVSADGRTVAGNGINPAGRYEAWIAHVPALCHGDLDDDGIVGLQDLATLLARFGTPTDAVYRDGDLDGDADVDLVDLTALLGRFGVTCP